MTTTKCIVPDLPFSDIFLPSQKIDNDIQYRNHIIKRIAEVTFKELAAGLAISALACLFVVSPAAMASLLITAVAITAINCSLRCTGAFLYLNFCHKETTRKVHHAFIEYLIELFEWIAPINFGTLNLSTRDLVIHESGHAAAASLLFENVRPKITLYPFNGGVTTFYPDKLSRLGEYVGGKNAETIVAAAGPAAAIVGSSIDIGVAHHCQNSHPRLSRYLKVMASFNILNHLAYAFSALSQAAQKVAGHDFVMIWRGGVHPCISMIAIIALPIMTKVGMYVMEKHPPHI